MTATKTKPKKNTAIVKETSPYADYAMYSAQLEALEALRKDAGVAILAELDREGVKSKETDWGTYTAAIRTTYAYSEKVTDLEKKVRRLKEDEVDAGTATVSKETKFITLR